MPENTAPDFEDIEHVARVLRRIGYVDLEYNDAELIIRPTEQFKAVLKAEGLTLADFLKLGVSVELLP